MPNLQFILPQKTIRWLVIWILLAINIGWIILALLNRELAVRLTLDDGIIQWAQFIFLLLTAFYCLRIVLGYRIFYGDKLIKYGFFALFALTLVVAFEEISWGQRIFNIRTPDAIKTLNIQNEINFHNLVFFHRHRHWLLLLFGIAGLTLIHLNTNKYRIDERFLFFSPPDFFRLAFSLILISGIALELAYIYLSLSAESMTKVFRFWAGRYSEIGELGVSITAFSYAAYEFNSLFFQNIHNVIKRSQ
ncbi:hypothetical protein ACFL1Z_09420 [Thermodesulfobacteriota bacterium]